MPTQAGIRLTSHLGSLLMGATNARLFSYLLEILLPEKIPTGVPVGIEDCLRISD
jgi:hypothetical protein